MGHELRHDSLNISFILLCEMTLPKFECKQCGNCCLNLWDAFCTCANEADIHIWEENGREDILAWVDPISVGDQFVYDIWIDPETGDDSSECPWLQKLPGQQKFICLIHEVKPAHCREYPHSREHAEKTGCPGIED